MEPPVGSISFFPKAPSALQPAPPTPQINIQTAGAPRHAHLVFFPIGKHSLSNDGSWQLLAGPISNLWRATATASRNSQTPPPPCIPSCSTLEQYRCKTKARLGRMGRVHMDDRLFVKTYKYRSKEVRKKL